MALFRDLVRTIAEAEGISEMTVTGIGQYLRDAGLISKHGRGRAAAQMSTTDAVNLLIAVNACSLAKDGPEAVQSFRDLYIRTSSIRFQGGGLLGKITAPEMCFGEAFELVLEAHKLNEAGTQIWRGFVDSDLLRFEIGFGRPSSAAYIRLSESMPPSPSNPFGWLAWETNLVFAHFWNRKRLWSQGEGRKDLTIIGDDTLSAVGKLLTT